VYVAAQGFDDQLSRAAKTATGREEVNEMLIEGLLVKALVSKAFASKGAVAAHGALVTKAGALGHSTLAANMPLLGHAVGMAPEGAVAVGHALGSAQLVAHPLVAPTLHTAIAGGDPMDWATLLGDTEEVLGLVGGAVVVSRVGSHIVNAIRRHAEGDRDEARRELLSAVQKGRPLRAALCPEWHDLLHTVESLGSPA
jgi:hypothetical protein